MAAALLPGWGSPAQEEGSAPAKPAAPRSGEVLPAQFQATCYEVLAAADRVSTLDAKTLASQAATPETLLEALTNVGPARILYRIAQPVNVFSERIQVGTSEPVVTGSRRSATGQAVNSISYHNVGIIMRLSAQAPLEDAKREGLDVRMAVQLATLTPSDTELAPGVKATANAPSRLTTLNR